MKVVSPTEIGESLKKYNLSQINRWMERNWSLVPKYQLIIGDRIASLKVQISNRDNDTCNSGDIDHFYHVIKRAPKFDMSTYRLLNIMTNSLVFPDYGGIPDIFNDLDLWTKVDILALMDKEKIETEKYQCFEKTLDKVLYTFYMRIIDIYIPTENPDLLAKTIMKISSLSEILSDAQYTEKIIERYKSCESVVSFKQIVLIHKIIADIYNNPEASYEFIEKEHKLFNTHYIIKEEVYEMVKKYHKYLEGKESPEVFIFSVFSLMGHGVTAHTANGYSLEDNINKFLEEFAFMYKREVPFPVLRLILLDVAKIIKSHDPNHYRDDAINYIMKQISMGWLDEKYNVPYDITEECTLLPTDTPITTLEEITKLAELDIATEAKELSAKMNNAEKKIYKAYRTYKENEEKVDSQITKGVNGIKGVLTGDVRSEIIEGKKFSAISLLKKYMACVALFSYSKIKFAALLVIRYALKKSTTDSERRKILMEIDTEIEMLDEKINDAKSDDNREAKYAMMRTRKELENAKSRIEYGMSADKGSLAKTKKTLDASREERGVV